MKDQYKLEQDGLIQTQNETNPKIFGTFTRNIVSQMVDVKTFATFLDEKELERDFGSKSKSVRVNLLKKLNSIQTPLEKRISSLTLNQNDWLAKINENLPFDSD